ncbi:MAG: hypothetical protein A3K19_17800 [Lentisphaerae bacterium RIFOXYB12_FULL_65_16]|nr:MAG: hypothetical protein A3K18_15035 [Lentisphaerae bacterium RIFOXYA12_64_32]OGV85303.1 MAG: hypothetical protein A3K19_17800 [Lentisphaerae bacterium RIFOXYB12_FULL_65_16]
MMEKANNWQSTADRILARVVAVQMQADEGAPVRDLVSTDEANRVLHHSLLAIMRHRAVLDWCIDRVAARDVRPRLRRVLRWGLCQLLYMESLPPAVAVDTCVRFVKRRHDVREAGFVNAVMRRLADAGRERLLADVAREAPPHVRLELGEALYRRWAARFPGDELERLAHLCLVPAPVIVRLRRGAPMPQLECLTPVVPPPWAQEEMLWSCLDAAAFFRSPEHARSDFYIQDPATLLAPRLLAVRPGERVGDLCAAPGGKALALAEALGSVSGLFCLDRSLHRIRLVLENFAPSGGCHAVVGDAAMPPFPPRSFDAVLLDVPCSNTGVLRRRPDVRWRFSSLALAELVALQGGILRGTADLVRPGGRLVYSTCSIEPEENGAQVRRFLAERGDYLLDRDEEVLPGPDHDGAYAALLRRQG